MSDLMKFLILSCLLVFLSTTRVARADAAAPKCPVNTTFRCGTRCPELCHVIGHELFKCPDGCVWGCFCNKGYIREFRGGRCIRENDCIR
ncbi:venom peptide SjAPI-2 [Cephus cinctus]|uniref:Venom peptide SjAPI-2 n=1 Tax=Cephus cinctus TaxID=211228 RepID=A0AAJ7FKD1_CEPCN|nr:venom peptide SjAPI-2 [Cephus cinctus]